MKIFKVHECSHNFDGEAFSCLIASAMNEVMNQIGEVLTSPEELELSANCGECVRNDLVVSLERTHVLTCFL